MQIAFLHTADIHVATFDALFAEHAPQVTLIHQVEPILLAKARAAGLDSVRDATHQALTKLATASPVLCTCSTLGPLVDEITPQYPNIIRCDRAMMEAACRIGGRVVVAICLNSTKSATLQLLNDCAQAAKADITPQLVVCHDAWAYFERGDMIGYAHKIAESVAAAHAETPADCIVLGQASMQVATDHLEQLGVPILSSPLPATKRILGIAAGLAGLA